MWSQHELNTELRSMGTALEVWNAADKYQSDIATTEAWIRTHEAWARGDTWWKSPDETTMTQISMTAQDNASALEKRQEVSRILHAVSGYHTDDTSRHLIILQCLRRA